MEKILNKVKNANTSINGILQYFEGYKEDTGNIDEVEHRLTLLEKYFNSFEKYQNEVEDMLEDPNQLKEQSELRAKIENIYFAAYGLGKAILRVSGKNTVKNELKVPVEVMSNIKLPPLRLPTFDGDHQTWLLFRDSFKANIHDNTSIAIIDKFQYLQTSLKGDALLAIQSIEVCEQNYESAWKQLNDRFNNKKLIVRKHLQMLFDIPTMKKESSAEIRHVIDNTKNNLQVLKNFQQPVDHWDQVVIFMIESKLDSVTRRDWEDESKGKEMPTLEKFINFLEN